MEQRVAELEMQVHDLEIIVLERKYEYDRACERYEGANRELFLERHELHAAEWRHAQAAIEKARDRRAQSDLVSVITEQVSEM